jgi:hypothetical protein
MRPQVHGSISSSHIHAPLTLTIASARVCVRFRCLSVCICVCECANACVSVGVCMCVCLQASVHACVRVCVRVERGPRVSTARRMSRVAFSAYFGKKVLFILEGDEWRELRALMRPAFMNHSLSSLAEDTAATAQILSQQLEAWEKRCAVSPLRRALSSRTVACWHAAHAPHALLVSTLSAACPCRSASCSAAAGKRSTCTSRSRCTT